MLEKSSLPASAVTNTGCAPARPADRGARRQRGLGRQAQVARASGPRRSRRRSRPDAGACSITPGRGCRVRWRLRPELLVMSDSTLGSRPLATPSASASEECRPSGCRQHVVADLGDLARARRAGVEDVLAHFSSTGRARSSAAGEPPTMKVSVPAARRQCRPLQARRSWRCRAPRRPAPPAGRIRRDGAALDDQRAGRDLAQQVLAQVQPFHVLAGGQHRDDDFGALHGVGGRRGRLGAPASVSVLTAAGARS